MIRLSGGTREIVYSPIVNHPVHDGSNDGTEYTFAHNRGTPPINVWVETNWSDTTAWVQMPDRVEAGGSLYYWQWSISTTPRNDPNIAAVQVARVSSLTTDIRIVMVF